MQRCHGGEPLAWSPSLPAPFASQGVAPAAPQPAPQRNETGARKRHEPPCPLDWGAWHDGNLLHSVDGITLPSCCELCRAFPACRFYNSAMDSTMRCLLLADRSEERLTFAEPSMQAVASSGVRTDGCSCASVGTYVSPPLPL